MSHILFPHVGREIIPLGEVYKESAVMMAGGRSC